MNYRTDLALEAHEISGGNMSGVKMDCVSKGIMKISRLHIQNDNASKKLGKPKGRYITAEGLPLTDNFRDVKEQIQALSDEIKPLIPQKGTILVIGIGNTEITPDSLGPKSADSVLATRHISGEIARSSGLDRLRPVAVLSPGVLGQTGIEVGELILSLTQSVKISAVVAIDALASRSISHLGRTIQISDSGIAPGSGIGNNRLSLTKSTLGIPVIGIGMPTVVDGMTLALDLLGEEHIPKNMLPGKYKEKLIVTPREIDLLTMRASKLIGMAVNCALQDQYSFEELASLVS